VSGSRSDVARLGGPWVRRPRRSQSAISTIRFGSLPKVPKPRGIGPYHAHASDACSRSCEGAGGASTASAVSSPAAIVATAARVAPGPCCATDGRPNWCWRARARPLPKSLRCRPLISCAVRARGASQPSSVYRAEPTRRNVRPTHNKPCYSAFGVFFSVGSPGSLAAAQVLHRPSSVTLPRLGLGGVAEVAC